jgi:hypothetical protein
MLKIPKIGKLRPMSIERLKQLPKATLTPEEKTRLLYDQVGNIKRVAQWTAFEYGWTFEKTREVLAWDIEHPTVTRKTYRRGKRGATVREVLLPEKVAEIRALYEKLGSVNKVAHETGIQLKHVQAILADQVAEKMAARVAGSSH